MPFLLKSQALRKKIILTINVITDKKIPVTSVDDVELRLPD
jgi:hypothetical protein